MRGSRAAVQLQPARGVREGRGGAARGHHRHLPLPRLHVRPQVPQGREGLERPRAGARMSSRCAAEQRLVEPVRQQHLDVRLGAV